MMSRNPNARRWMAGPYFLLIVLIIFTAAIKTTAYNGASFVKPPPLLPTSSLRTNGGRGPPSSSSSRSWRLFAGSTDGETANDDMNRISADMLADDLTKEELASRFAEVLDYYRTSNEMPQETVCLNMLRTRLPNLRLNRCFVAPSTIPESGSGLFASRKFLKGELVTLYPGDALLAWPKDVGDFSNGNVGVMFGNHVVGIDRDPNRVSTDVARSYELKIGTNHSIVADPLLVGDAAYLGHMINDGATLSSSSNASRTMYSRATFEKHNAAFFVMEGCHFAATATKDIERGQEIFVSYGEGYWLSRSVAAAASKKKSRGGFKR
jgi:hypothetical protein